MADTVLARRWPSFERIGRWVGGAALAVSIAFIGERLWRLDWSTLQPHASWGLAGAMIGAPLLFAAADKALARGWAAMVDPDDRCEAVELRRIYARGALMKYLPGSIFQYISRQIGGAQAGIVQKKLAQASVVEVGLHLVSSMTVAAACLAVAQYPLAIAVSAAAVIGGCLAIRRPLITALGFQILAFSFFAAAALLVGWAILPGGTNLSQFSALFLLAWLAGFVVPVAPGGIGIREAALIALGGGALPAAALMAATLALRAASIIGDLGYALFTLAAGRWRPDRES